MPDVKVMIGGRDYEVACQPGEEHYLHSAARLLDAEAQVLVNQIGRMPEPRMLLMAGLMLADKTAGVEDQMRTAKERVAELERQVAQLRATPPRTERVEVPAIPQQVLDELDRLAERAESLAEETERRGVVEA
ncbi:cell division protein ZapA [Palleronia abyssalis]|uniref:Cell division protein ZapA n=1 Tax=Palleronia abyssalis TaxID=1501240 RepID=A0A2R8BQI0_9RHOB|nr:cell division protein ZapA [Palleronia abyssalis]SPJ22391.1 hypothetical protein PAA8504_00183 [Palleronia abyssalis]